MHQPALLSFPCRFPIKAMGAAADDFDSRVLAIVRRHAPDVSEASVHSRDSRHGAYRAVTVTVEAQSRAQLDAIYQDLTACPDVLVAL